MLNGIDITRYRYDEYLALFSVVFQDYSLFGFPLGENVAAGLSYDAVRARECLISISSRFSTASVPWYMAFGRSR